MLTLVWFFFLTNQKYRCPRPRTGHFRGLVGFETKAKDLSFEARARTLKCVLEAKNVFEVSASVYSTLFITDFKHYALHFPKSVVFNLWGISRWWGMAELPRGESPVRQKNTASKF